MITKNWIATVRITETRNDEILGGVRSFDSHHGGQVTQDDDIC